MEESALPKSDEMNQILSRLYGSDAVNALPFSAQPSVELLITRPGVWRAGTLMVPRTEDGLRFDAFGLHWRLLAAGADTENNFDLFEVAAVDGAGMPARILGADEAIYVIEGAVKVESDGQSIGGGIGSFSYAPAGSSLIWTASGFSRLLVFHFPGGFFGELAGGCGRDTLVVAWLESIGTRFLVTMPIDGAVLTLAP
jgi:quercetin dioxygenase-like cupin family protein